LIAAIGTLAGKDLRLLLRDKAGFFFTFCFPLVYAMFFGVLFSGVGSKQTSLDLLVIDEDRTPGSQRLVASLQTDSRLRVEIVADRAAAADRVARGNRPAFVAIPPGFGAASERIFWGDPMRVEVGTDPGQSMTGGLVEGLITAHAYEQMQSVFTDRQAMQRNARSAYAAMRDSNGLSTSEKTVLGTLLTSLDQMADPNVFRPTSAPSTTQPTAAASSGQAGWRPIVVDAHTVSRATVGQPQRPRSSFAICFPQGMIWGVLACGATFAVSLLVERTRGTLPRLRVAPLAGWQILAGKALACFIATSVLMIVLLAIARVGFGVHMISVPLVILAIACVSLAIVGLMMVLSAVGRSEAAVNGISWALIVVMAMIGGGMIPLAFMPTWLRPFSNASLVKWAILALEGPIWRGYTAAEMLLPCGVLVGVGVLGFAVGAWRMRTTN